MDHSQRIYELLEQRVLFLDGAMGTNLQALGLPAEAWLGRENCSEVLNLTVPEAVRSVHEGFLAVGSDAVETNTFGANRLVLAEFGLEERVAEINRRAVEIARQACERFETPDRPRFVVGSMGPGSKLPSLGQVGWAALEAAYGEQAEALVAAGVDVLLVETCQDVLQTKAALAGIFGAMERLGRRVPVMAQVTMEPTGSMLVGTDIAAALAALEPYDLLTIGLNCATGPEEMAGYVAYLARHSPKRVSVLPNAGLPELVGGELRYPLTPASFAEWMARFVEEDGIEVVGGCCGTTPAHLEAAIRRIGHRRPRPREPSFEPALSSLYRAVPLQGEDVLFIGERTNANGSAAFRRRLAAEDWEGIVGMGRLQLKRGSQALDVCTAVVGRDEERDMVEVVSRFRTQVPAPLVIDSTEPRVLESALRLLAGRSLVNSVNLEAGPERAREVLRVARRHGAAVVALLIDERGMARELPRKLEVAERLLALAREEGLREHDLLFDPLTFAVTTGNPEDRELARWTLEAVRELRARHPDSGVILGVSNVSFGIAPRARQVLNTVFLHLAREAGLTAAIVHARGILPLFRVPEEQRRAAEDLLLARREDALARFLALFREEGPGLRDERPEPRSVEERLHRRVVDGDADGLEAELDEALSGRSAEAIVQDVLLPAMKEVGDLFARGETQLPFVLQSAEVMKRAVAYLEPHMPRREAAERGTIVLATVRGDVHDIGKNLVHILLANNGFRVVDLGIQQPVEAIIRAVREERADAVGLSGLLVRSTRVMAEDLEAMRRAGLDVPVILGGAALTRRFVEEDCSRAYGRPVAYARDAFDGLRFMEELEARRAEGPAPRREREGRGAGGGEAPEAEPPSPPVGRSRPLPDEAPAPVEDLPPEQLPRPPFWGSRLLEPPLEEVAELLNRRVLLSFHWGLKRGRLPREELEARRAEAERQLDALLERAREEGWFQPRAVYGYFPCHRRGDALRVHAPGEPGRLLLELRFPRQPFPGGLALPDYFAPEGGPPDVLPLGAVTVGPRASEEERRLFEQGRYRDYLYLHGLAVELAEATAEWLHRRIRRELGIDGQDAPSVEGLLRARYRGRRYAFGYPACPELEPQRRVLELLGAERAGITMTPEGALVPEQSTVLLVAHHPAARYFRV